MPETYSHHTLGWESPAKLKASQERDGLDQIAGLSTGQNKTDEIARVANSNMALGTEATLQKLPYNES